ncbi:hypothetical protein F4604DRAFT_1719959 [Suillus subluteus]|nr:hypothetical protein F4604DRAFT_1719959 [Suillus subluteus]
MGFVILLCTVKVLLVYIFIRGRITLSIRGHIDRVDIVICPSTMLVLCLYLISMIRAIHFILSTADWTLECHRLPTPQFDDHHAP